jgi:hypothetical protein
MPAQAPRPGVTQRKEEGAAARQVMTIRIRDEVRTIALGLIPIKEKLLVRKATGLPFDAFYSGEDSFGEDSLVVLWWLAGRANGDPFLTFTKAAEEWPADLSEEDIEVSVDEPDEQAADPEA